MRLYVTEEMHAVGGNGLVCLGRAEEELDRLLADYRSHVQLIYLDPPFTTGDTFSVKLKRGQGSVKIPLYADDMPRTEYLTFLRRILAACHELLAPSGSLYLHIDYRLHADMRLLLDEIFGESNFMNEIVWSYKTGGRSTRYYPRKHDTILFYRKSSKVYFDIRAVGVMRGAARRNHMRRVVEPDGRVCYTIKSNGKLYKYYEDTLVYPSDVWTDIEHLQQRDRERLGYATQKPEALLRRIILASSREGDLVADLFSGSGTTAAVAAKTHRRFLAVDASPVSLYTTRQRLLSVESQLDLLSTEPSELCFRFPQDLCEADVDMHCCNVHGKPFVQIDRAVLDGQNVPIVYAAAGACDGASFHPASSHCLPKMPIKMQLPAEQGAVIQLVNGYGRQVFLSVNSPIS